MLTKNDTLLSEALVKKELVRQEALQPVIDEASSSKDSFFSLILKKSLVAEDDLLKCLSDLVRIPVMELSDFKVEPVIAEKVPLKIAEYYRMVPVRLDKRKLTIAVSSPVDLRTRDDIRAHLGYEIEIVLARQKEIAEAVKKVYGFAAGTIHEMMATAAPQELADSTETALEDIEKMADGASVGKLVNQIILEAYRKRATDIHIEPYRGKVKLRYRIDGILYNANVPPEIVRFILPVLSRIKIMSSLNIVERRLPQDGRAIVKVEDTQLDLRVSSIPTPYGEGVVIRMLPMNRIFNLTQLGLSLEQLETFENLIQKPHGIILITGPTGSGKSTTLYACLNRINTDERKIITIEDPIEYEMDGVTQIQVLPAIGLDFARGLRSMLRHDPDVMMVGEIRDLETAEISIRVALTGHLVFSTLHTNDASSGITRLIDIGVEPYLVASSVESFIGQRLVRLICKHCKEENVTSAAFEMKKKIAKEVSLKSENEFKVYQGKGCSHCNFTGFWGRIAIYEILLISESIKSLIMKRATAGEIKKQARLEGMRTLRQDGWQKVIQGLTTIEEILKATQGDKEGNLAPEKEAQGFYPPRAAGPGQTGSPIPSDREQRIFMRLEHQVKIRYKLVERSQWSKDLLKKDGEFSLTKNVSAGGLLFIGKENIPVSAILELFIEVPDRGDPIECLARVVRQEEIEADKSYDTAVCFLDLSAPARSRLEKFVEKETR